MKQLKNEKDQKIENSLISEQNNEINKKIEEKIEEKKEENIEDEEIQFFHEKKYNKENINIIILKRMTQKNKGIKNELKI